MTRVHDRISDTSTDRRTLRKPTPRNLKLLARSQNALRGRWENFWASEQTCVVKLVDRDAVLDKLVYTATNPVADHLVERAHHWPDVNGLSALLNGRPLRATRPYRSARAGARTAALSIAATRSQRRSAILRLP